MANPAPDAGENATPIYGIRWPKPGTKAAQLALRFERLASDFEGALRMFGLPPVVSSQSVVAATASARDAHWGTPTTATTRRALQDVGATTIRTDLGISERYYASLTDGGANPGGRITSGWYRVTGKPFIEVSGLALTTGAAGALNSPIAWGGIESVVFPPGTNFTVPPIVILTVEGLAGVIMLGATVEPGTVTVSGFSYRALRVSSTTGPATNTKVHWTAKQMTSTTAAG